MSMFGSYELFAQCCATFFQPGDHGGVNTTLGLEARLSQSSFLFPPDILAMRTAGPKWNNAKLYGSFADLCFFLMEKDESEKGESEPLPEWPSLCCNLRQRFGYYESDRWPLDDDGSVKIVINEALAFP